jgi:DNA-binding beta-propeller fold protein YncE
MILFDSTIIKVTLKKYIVFILYTCCFLIYALGCATKGSQSSFFQIDAESANLSWPTSPQTARIKYIGTIAAPLETGEQKSWFSSFLFGKEEPIKVMLRPYGVCTDDNRVYVTDPGLSIVHIFDLEEKKYFCIDKANDEDLKSPIGIAADSNGDIYISDSVLKRIIIFNREGKYIKEAGSSEMFVRPAGIAIDEDRIYIVDTHAHKVLILSKKDGKFLSAFGGNGTGKGEFNYPTNIFKVKDGSLYITDSLNFRIQIFDRNGNFISSFGKQGDSLGDFSKPKGIAVDSEGHIYIADAHFDNVQIFDKNGKLLLTFGNTGRRDGEFTLPAGVFIDKHDRIYVADSYNNRIQIFQYLKEIK